MINSAKEAKEIFNQGRGLESVVNWKQARGYLDCLEGPEVTALVDAAERVRTAPIDQCGDGQGGWENHSETCPMFKLKEALAQYREAVKP